MTSKQEIMFNNINMNRDEILKNHLETIAGIADQKYQERVWIRGEGSECDDYTESICHFFDDGDPIMSNYTDYSITDRQLDALIKLRDALQEFNSNTRFQLRPDFIYSLEWAEIMTKAKEVLIEFNIKND